MMPKWKTFKRTYVDGHGPFAAPLLWIGEAPGKDEETRRQPFVGYTGRIVRSMIREAGMDPERDVRFDNAIPYNLYIPSYPAQRRALIQEYASHLDTSLTRGQPKVVVACGGVALERLHGSHSITSHAGCVIKTTFGKLHPKHPLPHVECLLIPCLHPAGVMNSKIWGDMLFVQRVITRAVAYATGELNYVQFAPETIVDPAPEELDDNLSQHRTVVIDTEFDPATNIPFMIGLSFITKPDIVYSLQRPLERYETVLRKHLARPDLTKVAHYIHAEIASFIALGIPVCQANWHDTMIMFATLYPDVSHSLSYMARFYLSNVHPWKDMDVFDPAYNALDVAHTCRVYRDFLLPELDEAGQLRLFQEEIVPAAIQCWALEERGLQVDPLVQQSIDYALQEESEALSKSIIDMVADIFEKRSTRQGKVVEDLDEKIARIDAAQFAPFRCPTHPTYNGIRKKRFTKLPETECRCAEIYDHPALHAAREDRAKIMKERTRNLAKHKRWSSSGFNPTNNDHVRWLLYDKNALALQVQRKPKKQGGGVTADANAISKLLSLKSTQSKAEVPALLTKIKRVQHIAKLRSTFLYPPVDRFNVAHPPYRMVLGTGRPASGDDPDISDRRPSTYAFNALNIPRETRRIFVPFPREHVEGTNDASREVHEEGQDGQAETPVVPRLQSGT